MGIGLTQLRTLATPGAGAIYVRAATAPTESVG